jgi:hypothetical protein
MVVRLPNPWGRSEPNLSNHEFKLNEKLWLIEEIVYHNGKASILAKKYKMGRNLLNIWVKRYRKNGKIHEVGRPTIIGSPIMRELKGMLTDKIHNTTTSDFVENLQDLHKKRMVETTNVAACSVKPVSRRSVGRLVEKMKLKKGKAEQTTDARAVATADKLNSVSIAAAHFLMVPLTSPHLIINADGTSYSTGGGLTAGVEVYYLADEQQGKTLKVPAQKESTLTSYFVKYYLCMTATGAIATPIYIVADDNMREGVIDVHEVVGLGLGQEVLGTGYVVFSKTRAVNEEFYRWWFMTVFTKFVIDLRMLHDIPDTVPVYFTLDGEDVQIKPLKSAAIQEVCRELNIIIGKPPASTTSISQPCDVGKVFMSSKTKNRHLKKVQDVIEAAMNTKLREVLRKHDVITGKKFKKHHVKAFILGIQIVQHILQTTLRKDMVSDSFSLTGQYIKQTGKCDVDIILGKCKEAFTTEEVTKIWAYLPTLCKILKEKGEIPEKDFLPLGMSEPVDPSKRGRDDLVLNRRRFCFLTNPFLIKREADKVLQKEAIAGEKADKVLKRKAAAEAKRLAPKPLKRARKNNPVIAADVVAPPAPDIAVAPV